MATMEDESRFEAFVLAPTRAHTDAERRWLASRSEADALDLLRERERVGAPEIELRRFRGRWGMPATGFTAAEVLDHQHP